jgi:hypothetical protein
LLTFLIASVMLFTAMTTVGYVRGNRLLRIEAVDPAGLLGAALLVGLAVIART